MLKIYNMFQSCYANLLKVEKRNVDLYMKSGLRLVCWKVNENLEATHALMEVDPVRKSKVHIPKNAVVCEYVDDDITEVHYKI